MHIFGRQKEKNIFYYDLLKSGFFVIIFRPLTVCLQIFSFLCVWHQNIWNIWNIPYILNNMYVFILEKQNVTKNKK